MITVQVWLHCLLKQYFCFIINRHNRILYFYYVYRCKPVALNFGYSTDSSEYNALMTWYVLSIFLNAYLWIKILKENSIIYVINTIFLIIFYNKPSIKSSRHCILISFYCTLTKDHPLVTIYLNIANYCQLDCCVVSNLR